MAKKGAGRENAIDRKRRKLEKNGEAAPRSKIVSDGEVLTALIKMRKKKAKEKKKNLADRRKEEEKTAVSTPDENAVTIWRDDAGSGAGKPLQGMDKWIAEYNARRPGFAVLQEQLDSFIAGFEEREEQARKEREAAASGDGWTLVSRQKGKKRTTDATSGTSVGAFAAAAAADAEPKTQALNDFYKFQKRDANRSEVLQLQLKFQEDKKKIAQMRAARKFRPY